MILDIQLFDEYQYKLTEGEYDLIVGGWTMSTTMNLADFFHSGGILNYTGYANEEMDRLLNVANSVVGEGATLLAYSDLQKHIAQELPYISIAYTNQALFTSQEVGGVIDPRAENIFNHVETWTFGNK